MIRNITDANNAYGLLLIDILIPLMGLTREARCNLWLIFGIIHKLAFSSQDPAFAAAPATSDAHMISNKYTKHVRNTNFGPIRMVGFCKIFVKNHIMGWIRIDFALLNAL